MRLLFCVLFLAGCSPVVGGDARHVLDDAVDAGADMAPGRQGDPCDPDHYLDPECAPGLVCTVDGICDGPVCGNGNVVCSGSTICEIAGNCVPPCRDAAGDVIYDGDSNCEGVGERTAADGRCYIPEWFRLCRKMGGH